MRKQSFVYNGYNYTLFERNILRRENVNRTTNTYTIYYDETNDSESCDIDFSVVTPEMHDGLFLWLKSDFDVEDFIMLAFAGSLGTPIDTILTSCGVDLTGITNAIIVRSL